MSSNDKADQVFQSLGREVIKLYRIYDGSDRVITQYEAVQNTENGGACLRTDYQYIGVTTKLEKMREVVDVWSSAYDI